MPTSPSPTSTSPQTSSQASASCFVGATGFVGKVALSMLLRPLPRDRQGLRAGAPGRRPPRRASASSRRSPPRRVFDPLRDVPGATGARGVPAREVRAARRRHRRPVAATSPRSSSQRSRARSTCIINCAGLVSFNPSLETALRINTCGAQARARRSAAQLGAPLVHMSTCFVAGNRDGEVWEDEAVRRLLPRSRDELDGARLLARRRRSPTASKHHRPAARAAPTTRRTPPSSASKAPTRLAGRGPRRRRREDAADRGAARAQDVDHRAS